MLLQLTQTCRQLKAEIEGHPSIYQNALGYDRVDRWGSNVAFALCRISNLVNSKEGSLFSKLYPRLDTVYGTDLCIGCLYDPKEECRELIGDGTVCNGYLILFKYWRFCQSRGGSRFAVRENY
ncbi:hypothetical protein BJ508DRAFT_95712 [Ascobolus immersus RN42]|uniref:Uncharacterized protein n=1 Tax=Ascobolus immersus RN42 TaxID=1160509 RepID=A0A3N4IS77_ASCIM|nr:hypothetical protein BJ508DRAFT_95712 [Ascobolus immersus RN42]